MNIIASKQEFTAAKADAAKITTGCRVFDIACGTGILAREAFSRVGRRVWF
jgi:ubiquinone/menaquinone biosynthesis C-methylase UbiE